MPSQEETNHKSVQLPLYISSNQKWLGVLVHFHCTPPPCATELTAEMIELASLARMLAWSESIRNTQDLSGMLQSDMSLPTDG